MVTRISHLAGIVRRIPVWYYLYAGIIAYVLLALSTPISEADIYWHIRMGQDILTEKRLTGNPEWTFGTYDQAWVTTQTVFEVLSYWIYSTFGWVGIYFIRILSTAAVFVATAWGIRQVIPLGYRKNYARILFLISALFLANITINYEERPQTLSYAFFAIFTVVVYRFLLTGNLPKLIPFSLFLLLWVWWHGSALLVVPLLGLAYTVRLIASFLGKQYPSYPHRLSFLTVVSFLGVSFLITFLNPVGWRIYERGFALSDSAPAFGIAEWLSPGLWTYTTIVVTLLILAYIISWGVLLRRHTISIRLLILEVMFLAVAWLYLSQTNRNLVLFGFLLVPFIARRLSQAWVSSATIKSVVLKEAAYILPLAFIAGMLIPFAMNLTNISSVPGHAPQRIFASLGILEDRKILNEYNYSGMLQLFTGHPTMIDGRNDRYRGEGLSNYLTLLYGKPDWETTLKQTYGEATDAVLREDRALVTLLRDKGWRTVCVDKNIVWLTKLDTPSSCIRKVNEPIVRGLE